MLFCLLILGSLRPCGGSHLRELIDVKRHQELHKTHPELSDPSVDLVGDYYFNGADLIQRKTRHALDNKLGGVMIWEIGQDTHSSQPSSLLAAITKTIATYHNGPTSKEEL